MTFCLFRLLLTIIFSELDQEMLGSSTIQKWKASASKKDCREAYRRALSEMDVAAVQT